MASVMIENLIDILIKTQLRNNCKKTLTLKLTQGLGTCAESP